MALTLSRVVHAASTMWGAGGGAESLDTSNCWRAPTKGKMEDMSSPSRDEQNERKGTSLELLASSPLPKKMEDMSRDAAAVKQNLIYSLS